MKSMRQKRINTSTGNIWPRIEAIEKKYNANPSAWRRVADEAASWFINEVWDRYNIVVEPTQKAANKIDFGISLIRDLMSANNKFFIPNDCVKLIWEIENYIEEDGELPNKNDHLLDGLRYLLAAIRYSSNEEVDDEKEDELARDKAIRTPNAIGDLYHQVQKERDWTYGIEDSIDVDDDNFNEDEDEFGWMKYG
jgi:hypothetical protein